MTAGSTITDPGTTDNVIDAEKVTLAEGTKQDNYVFGYLDGTLEVTDAAMGIAATPAEKFYDAEPTNITWVVTNATGGVIADATIYLREQGTTEWIPVADFVPYTDVTNVTVEVKAEKSGFASVEAEATVTIWPRIVVEHAGDAFKEYGPGETLEVLRQPAHYEDSDAEAEVAIDVYGENPPDANAIGFVSGEGFDLVPMTGDSYVDAPGTKLNVIDDAKVTFLENTNPGNYLIFYLDGTLEIRVRQEEIQGDVEIPEEAKKKINEVLNELVKSDPNVDREPYIKYQLTVMSTNNLSEATRTTPDIATKDAKAQIDLVEKTTGEKVAKAEFVDIILERTYSKTEAEETERGNYNKNNWDSLDKAEEHGNKLFEVTVPFELPEGMTLIGVTRSCANKGDEMLREKDPDDPDAEGFVYDSEKKTVTLYARDFCVFGFMMKEVEDESECEGICSWVDLEGTDSSEARIVYDFKSSVKTTVGKKGKPSKVKVKLGINDDRTALWFDDPCLEGGEYDGVPGVVVFDSKGRRKLDVSKLTNEQRTRLADDLRDYSDLGTGRKDGGSWCAEFTYTTEAGCYRAAGSKKLTATYELEDCCGDGRGGRFVDVTGTLPDIETVMLHRFGGVTLEKSNKIEIVAKIGNGPEPIYLRLAGQGELATLKDSRGRKRIGIKSMSGTVVGVIDGPKCESCCVLDADTVAFDCDGELIEQPVGSAAFGSFTLKFNSKRSDFSRARR